MKEADRRRWCIRDRPTY